MRKDWGSGIRTRELVSLYGISKNRGQQIDPYLPQSVLWDKDL